MYGLVWVIQYKDGQAEILGPDVAWSGIYLYVGCMSLKKKKSTFYPISYKWQQACKDTVSDGGAWLQMADKWQAIDLVIINGSMVL